MATTDEDIDAAWNAIGLCNTAIDAQERKLSTLYMTKYVLIPDQMVKIKIQKPPPKGNSYDTYDVQVRGCTREGLVWGYGLKLNNVAIVGEKPTMYFRTFTVV